MTSAAVVAGFCVVLLSSCSLLPFWPQGPFDREQADARMEQIAAAVNGHDAAARKALFSPNALEKATDLDERLGYVLSFSRTAYSPGNRIPYGLRAAMDLGVSC